MNFEYSLYILPLVAAALVSSWALFYIWLHRETKGANALIFLASGVIVWTIGYALEIAGADLATKLIWGKFQYFGIVVIPVAWLFFSVDYADQSFRLMRRFAWALIVIPFITLLLALTTESHGLIWKNYSVFRGSGFSVLQVIHGKWFWFYWGYSQLLILAGIAIVVYALVRARGAFRGQGALLLVAAFTPWIGNVLAITSGSPLDFTPFAFTISLVALVWAIFGFHLVDITPLARDRIIDSMQEGVIVLDARGNIVDINSAATRMIGVSVASAVGKTTEDIFSLWPHLIKRFRDVMEANDEFSVGEGAAKQIYDVSLSPLHDQQGRVAGRIIMMRVLAQPSFTRRAASQADTQPSPRLEAVEEDKDRADKGKVSVWSALVNFYSAPIKKDIPVPANVHPAWYRMRERIFTIILRFAASARTAILLLSVITTAKFSGADFIFAAIVTSLWVLSIGRNIKYELRAGVFLFLVYSFGFIETLNHGLSVQSFTFFTTFITVSAILIARRGAFFTWAAGLITMSAFTALINFKIFIPFTIALGSELPSYSLSDGLTSLLVSSASVSIIFLFIVTILENLNNVWQRESQALTLLQQERDLLERHVEERTRDLAEARDEAIKSSNELRKYYRAIEQSDVSVIIMDKNGMIEYVNPKFTEASGYLSAEALGKSPGFLYGLGEMYDFTQDAAWKTINEGKIWHGEFNNRRKDGSMFWESATIAPVHSQDGSVINFVEIKQDITEEKLVQEQLQRQNDYLSILHEITLDLLNRRRIKDLLQVIVDRSAVLLDAPFSELMLEEDGYLVVEAFTDNQSNLKRNRLTREQARLSWRAFDTHQPVVLEDYTVWEYRREPRQDLHATADFPAMAGDRCLGVLALGRSESGYTFSPEQVETGVLFARLVALVLDNANLYESAMNEIVERRRVEDALFTQNQYLSVLHKTTLDLLLSRDVASLLNTIVSQVAELVGASFGYVFLSDGDELVLRAAVSGFALNIGKREKKPGAGVLGQVWQTMKPLVVENYAEWEGRDPSYLKWGIRAVVGIPIIGREGPLGVLEVARLEDDMGRFTSQEIEVFVQFASLASIALDNAQLYNQAQSEISDRKHAETLLLESEARFRQIVENAGDIIYRTDVNGNFTYVNPTALVVMGYKSEEEVIGKNYLDLILSTSKRKMKRFYERQILAREKSTYYEFPAINALGEIVWFGQNVRLVEEGIRVVGFQAVARDITNLVQARESLAISRDQALEASRFKSQLLSRVSHELRTPLGGILGYAELIQYKAFGSLTEKQQNAIDNVIESTHYLTNIVNDLLDEAQVESKSLSLHEEYFNPADLLEKIKATMSVLANKKSLSFSVALAPDLPHELYGDINRLQQIAINLAGNAIKFTKEGEVSVAIKRPMPDRWSIEVQDSGVGIPMDEQQNIFEPFRQVSNSITRENRGSGLGLAITKQLIELMDGQITLQSEIGKGSLFVVTLPIINAPGE